MSVTEWYNSRKGQSLLVPGADPADRGQCVQAADYGLNEIYGLAYVWANAVDWWSLPGSLAGNFDQISDGSVKQGDFVIYSEGLVKYGHIDIAAQDGSTSDYTGYDSNWGGNKTLHEVRHNDPRYNQYILGVLRLKGGNYMPTKPTPQQVDEAYLKHNLNADGTAAPATQADRDYYSTQPIEVLYAVLLDHETDLVHKLVDQSQAGKVTLKPGDYHVN